VHPLGSLRKISKIQINFSKAEEWVVNFPGGGSPLTPSWTHFAWSMYPGTWNTNAKCIHASMLNVSMKILTWTHFA